MLQRANPFHLGKTKRFWMQTELASAGVKQQQCKRNRGSRATASVLKDTLFSILQAFGQSKPSGGEQG